MDKRPDDRFEDFHLWTREHHRIDWACVAVWSIAAALCLGFWAAVVWGIVTLGGFL